MLRLEHAERRIIGVIELDPDWEFALDPTGPATPWEHLLPSPDGAVNADVSVEELLADLAQLQDELAEEYSALIRGSLPC